MRFAVCLMLASALLNMAFADEHTTIVHAGMLLAVPGEAPKARQTIIINGNRITSIDDDFVVPADVAGQATLIDLSEKFVLPGLMDMHVHLLGELSPTSRTEVLHITTSAQALRGAMHAKRTLKAGFTTVRDLGVKVAAHAHGTDGINAALKAGVDSIDHGTFLDDESIILFRKTGTYLVPTLSPGHKVPATMEGNPFFTEAIKAKARAASAVSKSNFAKAYEGGVKIAFGTDSAVTKHGANADEFAMIVGAGMGEMDAIRSATVVAAELIGMSDSLGTIEPGKLADIIAVNGNPLDDISALTIVGAVIKDGKLQ